MAASGTTNREQSDCAQFITDQKIQGQGEGSVNFRRKWKWCFVQFLGSQKGGNGTWMYQELSKWLVSGL